MLLEVVDGCFTHSNKNRGHMWTSFPLIFLFKAFHTLWPLVREAMASSFKSVSFDFTRRDASTASYLSALPFWPVFSSPWPHHFPIHWLGWCTTSTCSLVTITTLYAIATYTSYQVGFDIGGRLFVILLISGGKEHIWQHEQRVKKSKKILEGGHNAKQDRRNCLHVACEKSKYEPKGHNFIKWLKFQFLLKPGWNGCELAISTLGPCLTMIL